MHTKFFLENEKATILFATQLATYCGADTVFYLYGDLGTGKTTMVRAFLTGFGATEKVKSPTYSLVEHYQVKEQMIYHFDLYRLENPHELTFIGIDEYFGNGSIVLVEWPENAGNFLPKADLSIFLKMMNEGRELIVKSHNKKGEQLLQKLLRDNALKVMQR